MNTLVMTTTAPPIPTAARLIPSTDDMRRRFVMEHCPNHLRGLYVAPSLPALVDHDTFDVTYVTLPGKPVPPELRSSGDIEWQSGRTLAECLGGQVFAYAVAAHVLEQMPNPLGWLCQLLACLEERGRLAILVTHRERSINYYRQDTTFAQVMAWAIANPSIPTPLQVMDFLSQSFDDACLAEHSAPKPDFSKAPRHYTDSQAVEFAKFSWNTSQRLDVHCSAWTPASFSEVFRRVIAAGLLDARIVGIHADEPTLSDREFLVILEKTAPGRGSDAE